MQLSRSTSGSRVRFRPLHLLIAATVLAALLVSGVVPGLAQAGDDDTKYHYYILIDTSASMVGGDGVSPTIFPLVQENLGDLIDALPEGIDVSLYAFDAGIHDTRSATIEGSAEREELKQWVNGLEAVGGGTWIYDSIARVLEEARVEAQQDPDTRQVQQIYLFTDGQDNSPADTDIDAILDQFGLDRSSNPYLFMRYITLGTTGDPRLVALEGVSVQEQASGELFSILTARVAPARLDFGNLRAADSAERVLSISYDPRLEGSTIRLDAISEAMEQAGALVEITPATVTFKADSTGDANTMRQNVTLIVSNPERLVEAGEIFEGQIVFASDVSGSIVDFLPAAIDFAADYRRISIITLEPIAGESLSGELGLIDLYADDYEPAAYGVRAVFNDEAMRTGASLTLAIRSEQADLPSWIRFIDEQGAEAMQVELTPDSPEALLSIDPPVGTDEGEYAVTVVLRPEGAALEGSGIEGGGDTAEPTHVAVTFEVPREPDPAWLAILKTVLLTLGIALAFAAIAFIAFVLIIAIKTGTSPFEVLALIGRKMKPKMRDATLIVERAGAAPDEVSLSGKAVHEMRFDLSAAGPVTVRFTHDVALGQAKEHLMVEITEGDADVFLDIERGATGDLVARRKAEFFDEDVMRVGEHTLRLASFTYRQ